MSSLMSDTESEATNSQFGIETPADPASFIELNSTSGRNSNFGLGNLAMMSPLIPVAGNVSRSSRFIMLILSCTPAREKRMALGSPASSIS